MYSCSDIKFGVLCIIFSYFIRFKSFCRFSMEIKWVNHYIVQLQGQYYTIIVSGILFMASIHKRTWEKGHCRHHEISFISWHSLKKTVVNVSYWQREEMSFRIVNFPFIRGNIPSAHTDGVFKSRYAGACRHYADLMHRARLLTIRLEQGYVLTR